MREEEVDLVKQVNLTGGIQAPDWIPVVARGSGKAEVSGCQESPSDIKACTA